MTTTAAQPLLKIQAALAAEVCAHFYMEKEAHEHLKRESSPREFLEVLLQHHEYIAAIDFLAHALSPRDAIWWGCLCWQHACGKTESQTEKAACASAMQWVLWPSDEHRESAKASALAAGMASSGGNLAAAASKTGGNANPHGLAPAPPSPYAPAKAVAMAVKFASNKAEPANRAKCQRSYVELGIGVAEGRFV